MKQKIFQRLFLLVFCLVYGVALGQNFSYQEFKSEKDTSRRIEMGAESWSYYIRNNLDSLGIVGLQIVNTDSVDLYGVGIRNLASYQVRGNNIKKGIKLLEEAKEIFSKQRELVLLSETENELGNAYFLIGDLQQSVNYFLASIVHGSGSSDNTASYNGMIGFGKAICAQGDTVQGLLFVQEFLERCLRDSKFEAASDACGFLGMIAGLDGKIELMSAYYRRGIRYSQRSSSTAHRANAITNKAIDYFYHDKVDSSIYFFQESLKIREDVGATRPIVESLYNLAILYIETDNLEEAKRYAERGEEISSERGIRSWQLDCLILLLEIAEKSNELSSIQPIELDIERIKNELDEMGSLDKRIIDLAVDFTSLHDTPIRRGYFWELISTIAIFLSSALLMYSNRASSISAGIQA